MRGPFSKLNNQNIYFEIYEVDEKNGEESGKVAYYDENLQLIIDELNWNVRVMAADSEGILFFSSQTKQRAFLTF